ncbi:hypothetical protein BKA61DRAFT_442770, partial [Leptodontidium sp. MPI-SDFR-AT-0119]
SILLRGTKTFKAGLDKTTIDLALTLNGLFYKLLKCQIYDIKYGLDYWAITSTFN